MHLKFVVTRAVAVVCALFVTLAVLGLLDRIVPEYHAFWSGVVFWSAGAAVLAIPAGLTWLLLTRHTRYAVAFAACAALWSIGSIVLFDSRIGAAAVFTAGMLLIFFAADRTIERLH